ncbi:MAG: hypothetical protein JST67_07980 [Bacteroidetes bacterium]|nr:hypothetical protein [Bacteroidota bacterium]
MSHHEEHHHEEPKKVYFGIPFAFALAFWFITFLCLKACDGHKDCCKEGEACCKENKECKAKTESAAPAEAATEAKKE